MSSAVDRLQASKLIPPLLGQDVDISGLLTWYKGTVGVDLDSATTDITIQPTIEGASTVTVSLVDQDRLLLRSGKLSSRQDIEIDGMWFRLVSADKSGKNLTLVFEDREVAILRTYNKPIKQSGATSRAKVTRAQFVLRMLQEVKEEKIPYFIPALNIVQPLDSAAAVSKSDNATVIVSKSHGIPVKNDLIVKGAPMTEEQRVNANTILTVGTSQGYIRKILVIAMMVAIQESSIVNLPQPSPGDFNYLGPDPDGNPVGVFQQIKKWGWPASRDVGTDATAFFAKAGQYTASDLQYYEIAEKVQNSGRGGLYAKWRVEADRIVLAWGHPETTTQDANSQWAETSNTGDYEFYRGLPPTTITRKQKYGSKWGPESSWDCANRLAADVDWRAFFAIGAGNKNTFYFISETDLINSQPIATIDEDSPGVDGIDGSYDEGKKAAQITLSVRMGRWEAPPGSVVVLVNMGPWNGRWLVNDISRSAYSSLGTITLKKNLPKLPEPSSSNIVGGQTAGTYSGAPAPTDNPAPGTYVDPLRDAKNVNYGRTDQGVDFGADYPSNILAVGLATILAADQNNAGWPGGGMITYQLKDGTHAGAIIYVAEWVDPLVKKGDTVQAGQPIARFRLVQPVPSSGTEMGWGTASGQPIEQVGHPGAGPRFARFLRVLGRTTAEDPGEGPNTYF